ncbi:MAG: hypothetical protein K9H64_17470 [Bacteroidales bacterium]|nr:hypothetical protein [Bacteroidales bacterium]MCF8457750.1 hypothetical protein [Bacteroidales bacterium]
MKRNLLLFGSLLVLLSSCAKEDSENVNQDSIYSIYELFYDVSTDKTIARATFRFGGPTGTLLELNTPAISTFNGDELLYNAVTGVHKKEYAGFTTSGTFVYTDHDNNTFTNTTPTINSIAFPVLDTISSAGAFTFAWVGDPIAANETVTLTIDGIQQGNFEIFASSVQGVSELVLAANRIQNLGIGNATCTLMRAYNKTTIDQGTSEGGRMAVWYSTTNTIYIGN